MLLTQAFVGVQKYMVYVGPTWHDIHSTWERLTQDTLLSANSDDHSSGLCGPIKSGVDDGPITFIAR